MPSDRLATAGGQVSRDALWMLMQCMQRETRWSSPVQLAVLVVLADSMNEKGDPKRGIPKGWAWPSKNTIAKRVKCSSRYVVRVMSELEALGLIEIRRGAGPQGANLYRLTSAVQFTPGGETSGLTSAVEFTPSEPTSAVQFTPDREPFTPPVNEPVNPEAQTGEQDSTRGMRRSSPELRKERCKEPSTAAAPRPNVSVEPNTKGNYAVVERLALNLLTERSFDDEGDFVEATKGACARLGIDYGRHPDVDADVVHRACASAWFKHRNPHLVGRTAVAS